MTMYRSGFTLIELLIATTIGAMIVAATSTLFFIIALNTTKIDARKETREVGSTISQNFNYLIQNALTLLPDENGNSCSETASSQLRLKSIDQGITELKIEKIDDDNYITSNSAKLNPKEVVPSDLSFSCIKNPAGETYLNYQFTLKLGELASQTFSNYILLRNSY